jgi:hypothetical protein
LADYYATTVLYVRVKLGAPVKLRVDGRVEPVVVRTVRQLAEHLTPGKTPDLAERRLLERIARLIELLPDPAVCSRTLAVRVDALRYGLVEAGLCVERVR